MRIFLKLVHYLAVSAFVGSVFGHVLLGAAFSAADMGSYRAILQAKAAMTDVLILGGMAVGVLSGLGLVLVGGGKRLLRPWLLVKLAAVALITANALLVLRPLGLEKVDLASGSIGGAQVLDALSAAGMRESIFGAVNLALVLVVITLSVARRLPFLLAPSRSPQA